MLGAVLVERTHKTRAQFADKSKEHNRTNTSMQFLASHPVQPPPNPISQEPAAVAALVASPVVEVDPLAAQPLEPPKARTLVISGNARLNIPRMGAGPPADRHPPAAFAAPAHPALLGGQTLAHQ